MFGIVNYWAYLGATVALCLTPGIDTVYIVTRSIAGGRGVGLASALGINTGLLVHTVLVGLGLSLVLVGVPEVYFGLRVVGAAYLAILGVRSIVSAWRGRGGGVGVGDGGAAGLAAGESLARTYAQGVLTNVLNPKIILFFLALLPQFVQVPNEFGPVPFLLLGLTYAACSTVWTVVLVLVAAPFSRLLARSGRAVTVTGLASGVVYVLLGLAVFAA